MIRLFMSSLLIMLTGLSVAQLKPCKPPKINHAELLKAESMVMPMQPQAVSRLIKVYFRIFRDNNGGNLAADLAQIETEFAQLQADFAPNNVCFANMGVEFINNTSLNADMDPESGVDVADLIPFVLPGCITIFYHANLIGYGGYAYNIPNTFLSVDRSAIGYAHTLSHEMGHCLGLLHTFENAYGLERIDGTNCSAAGDRVCDTEADPYVWNGTPCFSTSGCFYNGNCTDLNGSSNYDPPYSNIMSYWAQATCTVTHFTSLQYARTNAYLASDAGLIGTLSPNTYTLGPITLSSGLHLLSAIFGFTTSGTVTLSNSTTTSLQGQSVTLNPGFTASPTSGSILVRAATCSY